MTLTLTDWPKELDDALRLRAHAEGKRVDELALEVLRMGLALPPAPKRNLSEFSGTWVSDPDVDAALQDQDGIALELWR